MKTMLGCMVSSSVSVTAAAHLSPLVDYADGWKFADRE
jgi:L-Ala-D/L-Glu epimerase